MKITLDGCTTEPLSSYLKSLAIIRLVSEQIDANAKGFWNEGILNIDSKLDIDDIITFFLDDYKPTSIVAPWNRGSGFYKKDNKEGLNGILSSTHPRFSEYRETITKIQAMSTLLFERDKPKSDAQDDTELKQAIVQKCRNELPSKVVEWIDSALIINPRGELEYPPILGTGGNEGRLDYTNTFMKNIVDLLIDKSMANKSKLLLRNAIYNETVSGFTKVAGGQYDPGRAGGYNQGFGIEHKKFPTNPWNFILLLEGAMLWTSGIAKRHAATGKGYLRSPFTVRASSIGYSSSSDADNNNTRAEIWAPVWRNPLGLKELGAFLREGRSNVGSRDAKNGIEFAEAVSSLGVDRGVTEFVRYSILKRRGDSYIALPACHFPVRMRKETDLIRELDPVLQRLDIFLRKFQNEPPADYKSARRVINDAIYKVLLHGSPVYVKQLLAAIGKMEQLLAMRDKAKEPKLHSPLTGLTARWLTMADDGSIEFRLSVALASIRRTDDVGPIRANLMPIDPKKPYLWDSGKGQMAWMGESFSTKLSNVLSRRMMDSQRLNCRQNPVMAEIGLAAEDIAQFIDGNINEETIQDLLFGLMWLKWNDRDALSPVLDELRKRWSTPLQDHTILRSWALLKLLYLPTGIRTHSGDYIAVKPESLIIPLLRAGRITEACKVAQKRLYTTGLAPVKAEFSNDGSGNRMAASLLLPIRNQYELSNLVLDKNRNGGGN